MKDNKKGQKTVWVGSKIHADFKKHCQERGLKFGHAVENALEDYLIKAQMKAGFKNLH